RWPRTRRLTGNAGRTRPAQAVGEHRRPLHDDRSVRRHVRRYLCIGDDPIDVNGRPAGGREREVAGLVRRAVGAGEDEADLSRARIGIEQRQRLVVRLGGRALRQEPFLGRACHTARIGPAAPLAEVHCALRDNWLVGLDLSAEAHIREHGIGVEAEARARANRVSLHDRLAAFGVEGNGQLGRLPTRVWPSAKYQVRRGSATAMVPCPPWALSKYIARSATIGTSEVMKVENPAAWKS